VPIAFRAIGAVEKNIDSEDGSRD